MSAVMHIRAALAETRFPAPRVRSALDQLIDSLDHDLDRAGYRPSSATQARLENLLKAMHEAGSVAHGV